jgi:Zn-dependent protease
MSGTIRLARIAGISVFLHWSWFLLLFWEINLRTRYSSFIWNALETVAVFGIVTLHEFGHALACRQVGGRADQIVLWPLGGVAYVSPPPRPGATLWSIVAGPLVNVVLIPVLLPLLVFSDRGDLGEFFFSLNVINIGLLLFNILPIYPLDGGKILWALLWYVLGRAQSLMVAVIIGFVGVAGVAVLAVVIQSVWLAILAAFAGLQCYNGFKHAQALKRFAELPRRNEFSCPSCKASPPRGAFWACLPCRITFDTFETGAACPRCNTAFAKTACPNCGLSTPYTDWISAESVSKVL